jgi:hypothetical protein
VSSQSSSQGWTNLSGRLDTARPIGATREVGTAVEEDTTIGVVVDVIGVVTGTIAAIIITAIVVDTEDRVLLGIASIPTKLPFRWIQRLP